MKLAIALSYLLMFSDGGSSANMVKEFNELSEFYARKCIAKLTEGEEQRIRDRHRLPAPANLEILLAESNKVAECYGYIEGYVAGRNAGDSKQFCMPDEMDVGKVAELFVEAVETRPEAKNMPKDVLFESILSTNWACKSGTR